MGIAVTSSAISSLVAELYFSLHQWGQSTLSIHEHSSKAFARSTPDDCVTRPLAATGLKQRRRRNPILDQLYCRLPPRPPCNRLFSLPSGCFNHRFEINVDIRCDTRCNSNSGCYTEDFGISAMATAPGMFLDDQIRHIESCVINSREAEERQQQQGASHNKYSSRT